MCNSLDSAADIERLRQENEHYRKLLSYLSAGILVTSYSRDGGDIRVLETNEGFTKLTGYTTEEIAAQYGGIYMKLVDERDQEKVLEEIRTQIAVSNRYETTYRLNTRTGKSVWVKETGHLSGDQPAVKRSVLINVNEFILQQQQLLQSEQLFRITNTASGGAVFDFHFDTGSYLHFENAERIYGVPAQKIIEDTQWFGTLTPQKALTAMIDYFYHPDDAEIVASAFQRLAEEKAIHYVARSKRFDGTFLWTQVHIALIFDEHGTAVRRVGHLLDIDEIKRHADKMSQSEQLFRITNNASGGAVFDFDFTTGSYLHFENAESIYGVPAAKIISDTKWFGTLKPAKAIDAMIAYFYHPDDAYIVAEAFQSLATEHSITYMARSRRADGSYIWSRVHIALIFDETGTAVRRVGHIIDIDEMTKQMEKLKSQAQEDPLTGIYNKTAAQVIVNTVLKKKDDKLSALMVLDIDNFKGVNDTFGHAMGDAVLIDVCEKLKQTFGDQTLGRVGGDEFIVFAMSLENRAAIEEKAEQICALFRKTHVGPNKEYKISCSIGIAIPSNEHSFTELFKKADIALYRAKLQGKDCFCLYEEEQEQVNG